MRRLRSGIGLSRGLLNPAWISLTPVCSIMLTALLSSIPPPAITTIRARAAFTSCLSGRLLAMRFVLRRRSEPYLLQGRKVLPANEKICGHVKGTVAGYVERPCQFDQFARSARCPRCHGHRGCAEPRRPPQFPSNPNVPSHALKLFQAVKKIAAPGSDHHMQPRGDFGPHQLNTATLGVTPPRANC